MLKSLLLLLLLPSVTATPTPTSSMFSPPPPPEDPVFALNRLFNADPSPTKISCGIGAYRDNSGNPTVLSCVKKAKDLIGSSTQNEYLPISGDAEFLSLSRELCFGSDPSSNVSSIQSLSGTGGLYLSLKLLSQIGCKKVYASNPTWGNHKSLSLNAGLEYSTYTYLDLSNLSSPSIDISNFLSDLSSMPLNSAVILQACGHNPTGVDPTSEQWDMIVEKCRERKLYVIMDNAYQGEIGGRMDYVSITHI